jgi:hypothetical protein
MNSKTNEQEMAQAAGTLYRTIAADLSLVYVSAASTEEEI